MYDAFTRQETLQNEKHFVGFESTSRNSSNFEKSNKERRALKSYSVEKENQINGNDLMEQGEEVERIFSSFEFHEQILSFYE